LVPLLPLLPLFEFAYILPTPLLPLLALDGANQAECVGDTHPTGSAVSVVGGVGV